jgi:signal transduction histidine kinase
MSEHTLRHAFDPFYSDKAAGRRRGMGLARARSIVLAHEGQVLLESRPGEGTRASIVLTRWREQGSMGQAA